METYIPAIITASVALIAAVAAQFLNNWLTYRREEKKYLKEVYENFISEFFIDILTFVHIETLPRKGHDAKGEIDISTVIDNMFKKVHYGNEHLQSLHLEYKTLLYMEDFRGDTEKIAQLKICYYFLLYSKNIFQELDFKLESNVEFQLLHNTKILAYLYVYSEERDYEEAINKVVNIRMIARDALDQYSLVDFDTLVNETSNEKREEFLKEIDKKIQNANINL
ncbi:hypothetical protein COE51_21365 [Bacillus pseudomycoides]|nr:hypothetical protein COE51_21365 [Bacillus pseudomycoides]